MKVIPIPCLFDNYSYLLIDDSGHEAIVVDPGEAYPILKEVEKRGLYLTKVLCTHHHQDHVGGIDELLIEHPELEVYGFFTEQRRINGFSVGVTDGDQIYLGNLEIKIFHTPGHTSGSCCYLVGDCLMTGDSLFGGGAGRMFEGSAEQLYNSVVNVIGGLPEKTKIFFGHEYTLTNMRFASQVEPENEEVKKRKLLLEQQVGGAMSTPTTLGLEKRTNPFLRCHCPQVIENVKLQNNPHSDAVLDVFRALRQLRDSFS